MRERKHELLSMPGHFRYARGKLTREEHLAAARPGPKTANGDVTNIRRKGETTW
jgi:hypothetical protein